MLVFCVSYEPMRHIDIRLSLAFEPFNPNPRNDVIDSHEIQVYRGSQD